MNRQLARCNALPFVMILLMLLGMTFIIGCSQNSPDAIFNRGLRAMEENDAIGASLYFEEFLEKFPDDERAQFVHWHLAQAYLAIQDAAAARNIFKEIEEKYPTPENVFNAEFAIAKTYLDEGDVDQAISYFEDIREATSEAQIRYYANKGIASAYARQTKMATAVEYYDHMLDIAQNDIDEATKSLDLSLQALSSKAEIYRASKQFDNARDVYSKTLSLVKNATDIKGVDYVLQDAAINYVNTYVWAGDYVTSATMYDRLLDNDYIMADMKPRLIEWKIKSLQRLLGVENLDELEPENKAILIGEYQRLVKGYPNTDQGINARVEIARMVKDSTPEMAEEYFNEAIEMYEQDIENPPSEESPLIAMFQIMDANLRMGYFDQAKQIIQRLRQTYPNLPRVMQETERRLEYIRRQEAEPSPAEEPSTDAEQNPSQPQE